MKFTITDALHGAQVWTKSGKPVIGLHFNKEERGSYQLCGFIRSKDGTFGAHTWTIDGKFHAAASNDSEEDLWCEYVGHPWFDIAIVPGNYDGVMEYKDGDKNKEITVLRFWDKNINKSWQGEWEERGTATHWQNPGPSPADFQAIVDKNSIVLREGFVILETDYLHVNGKFQQLKTLSWATGRVNTKHDGKSLIVRLPANDKQ